MFAYEASSFTLTSVVTYVQAKIASHDDHCKPATFAPVTAPDSRLVNNYEPYQIV